MDESQFGKGAIRQPEVQLAGASIFEEKVGAILIDWEKGYDVRNEVGDIPFKNQYSSLSCTGQATAYQVQVYNYLETGKMIEVSPKSIYPFVRLEGGSAYISAAVDQATLVGSLYESVISSYRQDGTTDEAWMSDKTWWNEDLKFKAGMLKGKNQHMIRARTDIDVFAQAIEQNKGVIGGVEGSNNGTWLTEYPVPPTIIEWGHAIWFGGYGITNGKKWIATPNSWGNVLGHQWKPGDPPGAGWQKITEDYLKSGRVFNPFTYVDIPNMNMQQLIKGNQKDEIYAIGKDGKLRHIYSWEALKEGVTAGLWDEFIEARDTRPQAEVDAMPKSYDIGFLIGNK